MRVRGYELPIGVALLAVAAAGVLAMGGGRSDPPAPGSTLKATLRDADGDGALEPGSAEPLVARTELGAPAPAERTLATVGIISDAHVRDEESPARAPFLDRFGSPVDSTFRPHEALSAQVLDASVRAVRAERPDAVLVTGDLVDNAQRNELALALTVLRGGVARPDSGARGYDGPQRAGNPDPLYYRPDVDAPRHPGLLARAQRPFRATGLGARVLALLGNHDLLVQGELPPDASTRAIATGNHAVTGLARRPRLPDGSDPALRIAAIRRLLTDPAPGRERRVAADPARREIVPREMVTRLRDAGDLPGPREALDYVADVGGSLRILALDAVDRDGGSEGRITGGQLAWLRAQLARAGRRAVIVATHQPLRSSRGGDAVLRLLDASPAVVAAVSGHTHRHRIRPRHGAGGHGYWLIETASLADHPQQARMLRLVRTRGGRHALETWVVDHDGAGLAGLARELAYLDVQGGRPRRLDARRGDRNVRLGLPVG